MINRLGPTTVPSNSLTDNTTSSLDQMETRILVVNATPGGTEADGEEQLSAAEPNGLPKTNGDSKVKGKAKAQGGMRGGYVGLMNCVFAAQKAVSAIDIKHVRFGSRSIENPHRRAELTAASHKYLAANLPAAGGSSDRRDLLAMERPRRLAAVSSRKSDLLIVMTDADST